MTSRLNRKILFLTSPPLLDNALELIARAKNIADLHVVIYSSGTNINGTVLSYTSSFGQYGLISYSVVKKHLNHADVLDSYFSGCKSVHFAFFPKNISLDFFSVLSSLLRLKRSIKADIIHLDDFSGIILPFYFCSFATKKILNIHDAVAHAGELLSNRERLKRFLIKYSSHIVVFSKYSYRQLNRKYHIINKSTSLFLLPYMFYSKVRFNKEYKLALQDGEQVILFFGRISIYKGLEYLLKAFRNITQHNRNIKLVIAGKSEDECYTQGLQIAPEENIVFLKRFIPLDEMCSLFSQSSLLVCPYKEASQSGVLMTAAAFGIPVLASNVGSFSEYTPFLNNSFVYDSSQPGALEEMILNILNNPILDKKSNLNLEEYDKKLNTLYNN